MTRSRNVLALCLGGALLAIAAAPAARAAEGAPQPPRQTWSFSGPFGTYDRGAIAARLQGLPEVCQGCHSLSLVSFRNLAEAGGPGYSPAQAAAVAAEYKIKDGPNDQGEQFERDGRPADYFPSPFPNEQAARAANNGVVPPDFSRDRQGAHLRARLSLVRPRHLHAISGAGARLHRGPAAGLWRDAERHRRCRTACSYNKYFPGHAIGMPQPMQDGQVTYDDGAPQTLEQYAKDVAAFLMWTAEPHMEARKRLGFQVMIFLIVFAGLLYFTKKKVWSSVEGHA